MKTELATREYIVNAAKRYETPVAAAFRRALGIRDPKPKKPRRSRQNRPRHKPRIDKRDLEQCRRQRYGVRWRDQ